MKISRKTRKLTAVQRTSQQVHESFPETGESLSESQVNFPGTGNFLESRENFSGSFGGGTLHSSLLGKLPMKSRKHPEKFMKLLRDYS